MSDIRVYNTLTDKKEEFMPIVPGRIGMYVCGVTVYDHCHIGHARGAIIFDVIRRYFEYRGFQVRYVRNFTDVDDKIINRAKEEELKAWEIADKYTAEYYRDMEQLGVTPATLEPKATEHIQKIIELVKGLEEKGYAYRVDGDVFFEIDKFPGYGKLSNRDLESMRAGARVEIDPRKRDPLDFVLWKSAKDGEPSWMSPWGPGRPGWHIECSAMSMKHLGETFDIHGGGRDLIFPHHENEIAQSEAYTGKPLARYWLHNGFVNINREKMSKSLKNFFTIKEIIAEHPGESLRLFLLSTHYRSPINFSLSGVEEAGRALERIYNTFHMIERSLGERTEEVSEPSSDDLSPAFRQRLVAVRTGFERAMNDDFNTAEAIGGFYEVVREINIFLGEHPVLGTEERLFLRSMVNLIKELGGILGLFQAPWAKREYSDQIVHELMEILLEVRNICRSAKDWALADRIRSRLQEKGIIIEDLKDRTVWRRKEIP